MDFGLYLEFASRQGVPHLPNGPIPTQESTLYSMRRLGERVANYGFHAGTPGDWSAEGQRILSMSYDNWRRDKVAYGTPDAVADRLGQ